MGASAALLYAGTEPKRVTALACVDALGPPDMPPASAPARFATWIADVVRVHERGRRALASGDPAARLRERFPRFPAPVARHLVAHGTRVEDGIRAWKFDPLDQTRRRRSPTTSRRRGGSGAGSRARCSTSTARRVVSASMRRISRRGSRSSARGT
jgi:pimeloyl-ACP methyl ester carboxylesterase